jgi:hypothetical protein
MNITYAFSFHFLLCPFLYYTLIQSVTAQKRKHTHSVCTLPDIFLRKSSMNTIAES